MEVEILSKIAGWLRGWFFLHKNIDSLERHLKEEKLKKKDKGQRTMSHLKKALKMNESEIERAAHQSRHIKLRTTTDEKGFADKMLYEYIE